MGATLTNSALYVPDIGETGWGTLFNTGLSNHDAKGHGHWYPASGVAPSYPKYHVSSAWGQDPGDGGYTNDHEAGRPYAKFKTVEQAILKVPNVGGGGGTTPWTILLEPSKRTKVTYTRDGSGNVTAISGPALYPISGGTIFDSSGPTQYGGVLQLPWYTTIEAETGTGGDADDILTEYASALIVPANPSVAAGNWLVGVTRQSGVKNVAVSNPWGYGMALLGIYAWAKRAHVFGCLYDGIGTSNSGGDAQTLEQCVSQGNRGGLRGSQYATGETTNQLQVIGGDYTQNQLYCMRFDGSYGTWDSPEDLTSDMPNMIELSGSIRMHGGMGSLQIYGAHGIYVGHGVYFEVGSGGLGKAYVYIRGGSGVFGTVPQDPTVAVNYTYGVFLDGPYFHGYKLSPLVWSAATQRSLTDMVQPTTPNGHYYCLIKLKDYVTLTNNVTGGSEPTWPTNGSTVTDNGMTWQDLGFLNGKVIDCDQAWNVSLTKDCMLRGAATEIGSGQPPLFYYGANAYGGEVNAENLHGASRDPAPLTQAIAARVYNDVGGVANGNRISWWGPT